MRTVTENSTWQAHCEENTPAAAALVTGWNCTKAAVTPLQLLYNLCGMRGRQELFVVWTQKHYNTTEVLNLLLCNLCTYAVFFSETSC